MFLNYDYNFWTCNTYINTVKQIYYIIKLLSCYQIINCTYTDIDIV